ncbi:MAG: hypothetical protein IJ982_12340, partial [Fibrobacter sp.]|nr:hypothetical protein [Fibrobacter sp.]
MARERTEDNSCGTEWARMLITQIVFIEIHSPKECSHILRHNRAVIYKFLKIFCFYLVLLIPEIIVLCFFKMEYASQIIINHTNHIRTVCKLLPQYLIPCNTHIALPLQDAEGCALILL